jgi:hypothetical protein
VAASFFLFLMLVAGLQLGVEPGAAKPLRAERDPAALLDETDCLARVESVPAGARVSVNGLAIGLTPTEIEAACDETVDLEVDREGYERISQPIRVKTKTAKLVLTLIPRAVNLTPGSHEE